MSSTQRYMDKGKIVKIITREECNIGTDYLLLSTNKHCL